MDAANLSATKLIETDFEGAELELANFSHAIFINVKLVGAYLIHGLISEEQLNYAKMFFLMPASVIEIARNKNIRKCIKS